MCEKIFSRCRRENRIKRKIEKLEQKLKKIWRKEEEKRIIKQCMNARKR